ncbi:ICP0-binding domain of ubiquitin-specific protease 7-domain-containing protein [Rhizoctonia solani]|nr:ICP0-binding domain of ubiquitin-specific protease 7-domain-containing protein [Rhizoctonia solani]
MSSTTIPESWGNSPSDDFYTIKILREDTFRGYEGFDLADSCDESPSSNVLVFYVPKIESYGVFKTVVLSHVKMSTENVRFWVCFNRQNGTIRPFEPVKREMADSAPITELVSHHGTSPRIKMYLEFSDDKSPPLGTRSLVFLKHFDVQGQRIYGIKNIYVHNSSNVSSLHGKINRLMRWRPPRKLLLYEIKPDRIDCLDGNKSFADSEIVNGDIICFQEALGAAETQTLRTQYPGLVLDAIQFYAKMRSKSQGTIYPKVPKQAIDFVVLPGQSFEDALKCLQERMDISNKDLAGYKFTCSKENDSDIAYSNFNSLMTCTICLELLVDPVSFMDCMHVTCGACAVEWFRHSSTCHQCRQPVHAIHYIHVIAATVEAYCQYNRLPNRSATELADLRTKYKPGQLIEISRLEKEDNDPAVEERPISTTGCCCCNPGNELHFLCPEPILDDDGNTMFPGHTRCVDCNAHLPLIPEFSLECCECSGTKSHVAILNPQFY